MRLGFPACAPGLTAFLKIKNLNLATDTAGAFLRELKSDFWPSHSVVNNYICQAANQTL